MLTDDGKHLYVSWDEYHRLIEKLALKVAASGWEFDQILCLARGGMRPGDVLSRVFDKPLAIMATSSYRSDGGTIQGRLDMAKYITLPKGDISGIVRAHGLAQATLANIRQNLGFAFGYNAIGIPIAAGVLYPIIGVQLSPMIAAAAMAASSLSVVTNANRLRRWQPSRTSAGDPTSAAEADTVPQLA